MKEFAKPLPAAAIAAAFLAKATIVTTLSRETLDLLCYTAHGYSLAIYGQPLLDRPVCAARKGIRIHQRHSDETSSVPLHTQQLGVVSNVWRNWKDKVATDPRFLRDQMSGIHTLYRQTRKLRRPAPRDLLSRQLSPRRPRFQPGVLMFAIPPDTPPSLIHRHP